jgi:dienelactone hydrolase
MSIPDSEITRALSSLVFGRNAQRRKLAEDTRQYATRSGKIAKAYRQGGVTGFSFGGTWGACQ